MAAVKAGNLVRSADQNPLATIIQAAPVYVSFPVPQRSLPELRDDSDRVRQKNFPPAAPGFGPAKKPWWQLW